MCLSSQSAFKVRLAASFFFFFFIIRVQSGLSETRPAILSKGIPTPQGTSVSSTGTGAFNNSRLTRHYYDARGFERRLEKDCFAHKLRAQYAQLSRIVKHYGQH